MASSDVELYSPDPEHYTSAPADAPQVGTKRGPGRRPGARKPGRKSKKAAGTVLERRAEIQARVAKHAAADDFARRCQEIYRVKPHYVQVAAQLTLEYGETITVDRVKRAFLNKTRAIEALDDVRYIQYDALASLAARLRKMLDEYDETPGLEIDMEGYSKVADSYLRCLAQISKLLGLDAPPKKAEHAPPSQMHGSIVHVGPDGVTVMMPNSVSAYEEYVALSEKGLTKVAGQVLELEASEGTDVLPEFHTGDKAGVTLRPDADVTPGAEKPRTALDALAILTGDK